MRRETISEAKDDFPVIIDLRSEPSFVAKFIFAANTKRGRFALGQNQENARFHVVAHLKMTSANRFFTIISECESKKCFNCCESKNENKIQQEE